MGNHTAHHTRHGLHWSKLPELHAQLAQEIPANLYRQPGIPFVWRGSEEKLVLSEHEVAALSGRPVEGSGEKLAA